MLPLLNPKPLYLKDCFGIELQSHLRTAMSLQISGAVLIKTAFESHHCHCVPGAGFKFSIKNKSPFHNKIPHSNLKMSSSKAAITYLLHTSSTSAPGLN